MPHRKLLFCDGAKRRHCGLPTFENRLGLITWFSVLGVLVPCLQPPSSPYNRCNPHLRAWHMRRAACRGMLCPGSCKGKKMFAGGWKALLLRHCRLAKQLIEELNHAK